MVNCILIDTIYRLRRAAPFSLVRTVNQGLQDSQIFKLDFKSIVRKTLQHCCHGSSFIWASRQKCNTLILHHERWDTKLAFCQAPFVLLKFTFRHCKCRARMQQVRVPCRNRISHAHSFYKDHASSASFICGQHKKALIVCS